MRVSTCFVLVCGGLFGLIYVSRARIEVDGLQKRLVQAQQRALGAQDELKRTQDELKRTREEQRPTISVTSAPGAAAAPGASTAASSAVRVTATANVSAQALLESQSQWEWSMMAKEMLQPFSSITQEQLDAAVRTCFENGTMYCMRAQVVSGNLYITDYRAIFFDRWYAPARVMTLLDMLRWHSVPDIDIVVAAVDEPRIKMSINDVQWTKTVQLYPGSTIDRETGRRVSSLPPPLFSSTVNRASHDLPWPDFSFYTPRKEHKLRTPPWSELHPKMLEQSARVRWEDKIELAMHTGNVGSPFRKRLATVAQSNPDTILVNELFIGDHAKITKRCVERGLHTKGGYQKHECYMTFEDQCSYKFLLNSASIGYANKFKYLLLCGSVVIYVQDGMVHKEFYEYGLQPGVHYVTAPTAGDVPNLVRYLKAHDSYARSVAYAGRMRMAALDARAIAAFNAELFRQYAAKQKFRVRPQPGAVRIECEDDLWRHYARDPHFLKHYIVQDNATCIHKISGPFKPPGYGGAYNLSKVRCIASHDQRPGAQPLMCHPGAEVEEDQNPGEFRFAHKIIKTKRAVQPGTSYAPYNEFPVVGNDNIKWYGL